MKKNEYLDKIISKLRLGASIADFGCGNGDFLIALKEKRPDLKIIGLDMLQPNSNHTMLDQYFQVDLNDRLDKIQDSSFDFCISQHLIEHLANPLILFSEIVRLTKPNGFIFIESPSDRSTWFSFPRNQHMNLILSFYDDPTHIGRPWTPQAFYRLGLYHGLEVLFSKYDSNLIEKIKLPFSFASWLCTKNTDKFVESYWLATGWVCFAGFQKIETSHHQINYYSLKGFPHSKKVYDNGFF